jgi:hypothetical protein
MEMLLDIVNKNIQKHSRNFKTPKILQVITENFMEMLLDMVNQNIQEHSRNFKTPKIKNMRRHRNK